MPDPEGPPPAPQGRASPVRTRPVAPEDAAAIAGLMPGLGFAPNAQEVARRLALVPDRRSDPAFVAEAEGRVVGVVALHIALTLFYPAPRARITALVVEDSHRRRGVGRVLMAAAADVARGAGCDAIELTTGLHRNGARAFYRGLDFEVAAEHLIRRLA